MMFVCKSIEWKNPTNAYGKKKENDTVTNGITEEKKDENGQR